MRHFFIGDIHGCIDEAIELLQKFSPQFDDKIFQTGDFINKGPDSIGALNFIRENNIRCVMGNHEAKLLRILETAPELRTEKELRFLESVREPERIAKIVRDLPLWIDTGKFLLLHAGLEPEKKSLAEMDPKWILSIREWNGKAWYEQASIPDRVVIFGHWAMNGLVDFPHAKGLDTGCVYGKLLTGYCPEENRFYQIPAHREYTKGKGVY
ncbi:serine/threonine protein phosphatase [Fibrobacterales bacterium]|nr:serine/threonine protein phosphatase [Fibrobacterales bacterium]